MDEDFQMSGSTEYIIPISMQQSKVFLVLLLAILKNNNNNNNNNILLNLIFHAIIISIVVKLTYMIGEYYLLKLYENM